MKVEDRSRDFSTKGAAKAQGLGDDQLKLMADAIIESVEEMCAGK